MRFDRLRLCGFKSFVEPVEIDIKPGMTGIVGPNGCGKSNLVEGLRWLMGASSAKAMRASGMDEVIFAGTSGGRSARSWAEVSLEIDNSERRAPAQFNSVDTLTISRRVVRRADGSVSSYTINGKEVRARDVQMLFADASTGATSPALVRQGQISELINAKPTERRRFLEEAAGVTGLAARRHEAQLRLKAAADNLERLDDVIGELEVQFEQLSRQARKAARYRALSDEIKETERRLQAARIGAAQRLHAQLDKQVDSRRTQLAEAASHAASADREATEAVGRLEEARRAERETATALTEATAALRSFEKEAELRRQAAEERVRQRDKLVADEDRESALLHEATQAITAAGERIGALEEALGSEGETRDDLELKARQAEVNAEEAETAFETAQTQAAERRAEARAAEQERQSAERRLAEAEKVHADLTARLGELPPADDDALADAETAAAHARESLAAAEAELTSATDGLAAAEHAAREADTGRREAKERLALLEKEAAVLRPLIPQRTDDAAGEHVLNLVSAPEEARAALASGLGDALNAALGDADHAWTDLGRDTDGMTTLPGGLRPLASLIDGPVELSRALAAIGVVEGQPDPEQVTALAPGQAIVNTVGDLWRWDGYRRLGTREKHLEELLAAAARLQSVEDDITAARDLLAQCEDSAAETKDAAERAKARHATAERAAKDAARSERQAAEALERLGREQESLRIRRDTLSEQVTAAAEARDEARVRKQAADRQSAGEPVDDEALTRLRTARDEARRLASQARGQAAEHRRMTQQRRETLRREQAQLEAWRQRRAAAQSRIGELAEQRSRIEAEIGQDSAAESDENGAPALELALEEANRAWERKRDELAQAEQAASQADRKRRDADAAAASLREALAETSAELRAAKERLDEVLEAAGLSVDEAMEIVAGESESDPVDTLQHRLHKLERERERLGAVNLLAADEQTQVDERLSSLRRERGDCEEAAAQLQTAVNAINREGRQRLLAAFEAVNGHFRELFTSLFRGGEAHLKFVDSDDPLAAGLEIFACPPGKKPQSLSLMSGGEQALTATALIFAAFRTNPAPICVLDEVDAPLDDANVERFCDLLSLMSRSSETRFIVVTHHPLTMSRMDRLFGVTMMERGVSQLFSLDLDSARRLAA